LLAFNGSLEFRLQAAYRVRAFSGRVNPELQTFGTFLTIWITNNENPRSNRSGSPRDLEYFSCDRLLRMRLPPAFQDFMRLIEFEIVHFQPSGVNLFRFQVRRVAIGASDKASGNRRDVQQTHDRSGMISINAPEVTLNQRRRQFLRARQFTG
jgi:hypothetical protein